MWELWGCGDPTRNQLASLTANISIRILSSSDPEPDWSGVQDTAGMTSDVHTGLSPPSDISEVLRVMLLRWARVVVSWMKRSLVRTPIMIQSLTSSQMLTFLFHFTAVQSFGKSNNHDFAHITSGGFSLPVSFI